MAPIQVKQLIHHAYGDPPKVMKLETATISGDVKDDEALIRWMASPVNPSDYNMIQGTYGVKPPVPHIPGNEGVGKVEKVGSNVTDLVIGDWVIPNMVVDPEALNTGGDGIWRTHQAIPVKHLMKVPNDLPVSSLAMIMVNPTTAYRMLRDYVKMEPGDYVLQNGSTSAVGRAVIQIAKDMGLKTINLIRSKEDKKEEEAIKKDLTSIGADHVFTEDEFKWNRKFWATLPPLKLALNCMGAKSPFYLANVLGWKAKLVTYGAMTQQPLQIPAGALIWKQVTCCGIWLSEWAADPANKEAFDEMFQDLFRLIREGKLKDKPFDKVPMAQHLRAMERAYGSRKQLLMFE